MLGLLGLFAQFTSCSDDCCLLAGLLKVTGDPATLQNLPIISHRTAFMADFAAETNTSRLSAASIKARLIFATSKSRTLACGSKAAENNTWTLALAFSCIVSHTPADSKKHLGSQQG